MKVFSTIVKLILLSAVMTVATTSCDSDIDPVYVFSDADGKLKRIG